MTRFYNYLQETKNNYINEKLIKINKQDINEIYKPLEEKSYTQQDIPENFYVVFDLERTIDELKKQKIKGLKGISSSNEIQFQFLGVARDAMLEMDSKKLLKKNDVTRIMYDNPHYLASKNMWALKRIYQDSPGKWTSSSINHVFGNIFEYLQAIIKKSGKHGNFVHDATYEGFRNVDSSWSKEMANKLKINNLKDLTEIIKNYINNIFSKKTKRKYDFTSKELYKYLYETLERIGKIYSSENEWVVKNDYLTIPQNSNLYVLVPQWPEYKEETYEMVKEWIKKNPDEDLDSMVGMEVTMYIINNYGKEKLGGPTDYYIKLYKIDKMLEKVEDVYNIIKIGEKEFKAKQSKYFKTEK